MVTNYQRQRARERAALVAEWRLHPEVTYEEACRHGAAWIRSLPERVERIMLTPAEIIRFGHIPSGADAYELVLMRQQYDRL